jgi:CheY-like chemotaxis protein
MGEQTSPARPRGLVLVIDDDPDILDAVAFVLGSEGYGTLTARNGAEALELLRGSPPPCLILLDLMMPVLNGWAFRTIQVADPALSGIPVLAMTGLGTLADVTSLDVAGTLEKPVDLDRLLAAVARYCR